MTQLKRGTTLFHGSNNDEFFIGTLKRIIRINSSNQKRAIEALAIGDTSLEISPVLINQLKSQQLLDEHVGPILLTRKFQTNLRKRAKATKGDERESFYARLRNRLNPELSQTTWIDGVNDGGIGILNQRQVPTIQISGKSRVTILLYQILIASGVTQVSLSPSNIAGSENINDLDIAIGGIRESDAGREFREVLESLRTEYALFPLDNGRDYSQIVAAPTVRIHYGDIDIEDLHNWMSADTAIILINQPLADSITLGPIIIGGKTPCRRCVELLIRDQNGYSSLRTLVNSSEEIPLAHAYFLAGLLSTQLLQFIDTGQSSLLGALIRIDYQDLCNPQHIPIARHPQCGCTFQSPR